MVGIYYIICLYTCAYVFYEATYDVYIHTLCICIVCMYMYIYVGMYIGMQCSHVCTMYVCKVYPMSQPSVPDVASG